MTTTLKTSPAMTPLSENAPVALLAIAADGTIRDTNPAAEALFGLSRRGLVGKTLESVTVGSDDLLHLMDHAQRAQTDIAAPDITMKPVGLSDEIQATVRVRWFASGEMVVALSSALTQESEDPVAGVASFGRILGHEIKNPLAGISGAAQLLLRRAPKGDQELLTLIQEESARIERLVNRLSAFELFSKPQFASMNIHRVLDRVLASEEAAFDGELVFQRRYDPSLPNIEGDSDHLHEAFQNIVRNGIEAALANAPSKPPKVTIHTAFESRFARRATGQTSSARRALRIDITDSGAGLSRSRLSTVFDAFSSSKSAGRGLGLTVVKEVVAAHSGHVNLRNTDAGTRVSVFLPFAQGQV